MMDPIFISLGTTGSGDKSHMKPMISFEVITISARSSSDFVLLQCHGWVSLTQRERLHEVQSLRGALKMSKSLQFALICGPL